MGHLVFLFLAAQTIHWSDVPPPIRSHLAVSEQHFDDYIRDINIETERRVREGELEHLVYFILQSRSFTSRPPIEPALSGNAPEAVQARIADFLKARITTDPRLRYFKSLNATHHQVDAAWKRSLEFLKNMDYQKRAHSSDTQLASSYTVWNAIQVLLASKPPIRSVLIIGPGADLAPRTGFDDSVPPQSYQPYAVAAALGPAAQIECADVNQRVLDTINDRKPRFRIEPGTSDFMEYERSLAATSIELRISKVRLNIVTERLPRHYDLIIATNVLLYFPRPQLALALSNIAAMLAPGGYFVHNDTRLETEQYTKGMDLKWIQARRILIAEGRKAPLYDIFAIVRK